MTQPGPKPTAGIDRLLARVVETAGPLSTSCWIPTYATTTNGYVTVRADGRLMRAHRCTYEHFVGPIPEGFDIDHLCRVRACCNPDHLESVTRAENLRRGMSPAFVAVRTNTCKRGHSLDADSYVNHRGHRQCRACARIRQAAT